MDIVEVNQVIMLRPTQSPIVFIQQLGRGLRKAPGKEYVVILDFIGNYNNYLWPSLIIKDKEKYFVSMGLKAFFSGYGAYGMEWGSIMAACCVVVVPLILIVAFGQKWIIKGITSDSGVKE